MARIGVAVLETAFARWAAPDGEDFRHAFDRAVDGVAEQFSRRTASRGGG
ncbi:hypothetical protein [Actinomycetospora sp. TBRC 11914]|nr:hypothetical protein [Actinomycetospora sp. TBRC 11914]NMO93225.1 hypothetical protein [Actinomycetospora sp. TBRC 11914]